MNVRNLYVMHSSPGSAPRFREICSFFWVTSFGQPGLFDIIDSDVAMTEHTNQFVSILFTLHFLDQGNKHAVTILWWSSIEVLFPSVWVRDNFTPLVPLIAQRKCTVWWQISDIDLIIIAVTNQSKWIRCVYRTAFYSVWIYNVKILLINSSFN